MDAKVPLKLVYKDNVVRVSADAASLSVAVLERLVLDAFGVQFVALKYTDPEGDLVTIASDEDVHTALALLARADGAFGTVRVTAVPTARSAFHESVVEPVARAMEQLAESLDAAKAHVARESAPAPAHARNAALAGAVADARESLAAARERLQELPLERLVLDASAGLRSAAERARGAVADAARDARVQGAADGLRSAAEGVGRRARGAVADVARDASVQELAAGLRTVAGGLGDVAKEAVGELRSKVAPLLASPQAQAAVVPVVASDASADVTSDASADVTSDSVEAVTTTTTDSDWEQVATETEAAEAATPTAAPEPSAAERQWAAQLATIREVVPGVAAARAVEALERAGGDLAVALDALVDDM